MHMYETLMGLWYGNIVPCEMRVKKNEKDKETVALLDRYFTALEANMDEAEKDILRKFDDCHGKLLQNECEDTFIEGFSLGVKLMVEVFAKE